MAKKSLVVTSEAELRTKALELALHEAFQGVAAQDAAAVVARAQAFFEFLMPGYTPPVDER
jgi:hypothetical protein